MWYLIIFEIYDVLKVPYYRLKLAYHKKQQGVQLDKLFILQWWENFFSAVLSILFISCAHKKKTAV